MVYFNPRLQVPSSNELNQFLTDEEFHALMYSFTKEKLSTGQYLMKQSQNDEILKMYVVERGEFEVFTDTKFTPKFPALTLTAGAVLDHRNIMID